jgi:mycoredoxin
VSLVDRLLRRPAATWADAERAGHAGVWIYHRPGCPFCVALRMGLGRRGAQARWIDIWQDPEAAVFVRTVNGGNETVPTVVVDGTAMTNPPPARVRAALGG